MRKNTWARCIGCFAAVIICCLFFGQGNGLVSTKAAEPQRYRAELSYINPLYADVLTENELEVTAPVYFSDGEIEYHESVEVAAAALRDQLEARETNITVGIVYDEWTEDVAQYVFDGALAHTGTPTEGDYIQFTYGGWRCSISGMQEDEHYLMTLTYTVTYYTTAEQETEMDAAIEVLKSELGLNDADDYSIVCGIYDYICDNIVYDYDNLSDAGYMLKYTAYAALMDKTAVCQGYANLFYRLALEYGVDARVIAGDAGGPHAWNIVELGNRYYNLDSTWDAGNSEYDYFLKNPEGFADHIRDVEYDTEAFHAAYPMSEYSYSDLPEPTPTPVVDPVEAFVERMYTLIMNRPADSGLDYWVGELKSGAKTGAEVAAGFVLSEEFLAKEMTNEAFIQIMYQTFFDREADEGGLAWWLDAIGNGKSKQEAFAGFVNSDEFGEVCAAYGITQGSVTLPEEPTVSEFVKRLYSEIMGRDADEGGLSYWVGELEGQRQTGAEAAAGFILSDEFQEKEMTNAEYIGIMYRTFFGRSADEGGLAWWLNAMKNGDSKWKVFAGFANSDEFGTLCETYGIIQGSITEPTEDPAPTPTPEPTVSEFVKRLYSEIMGRDADEGGLSYWVGELEGQKQTGAQAAAGFILSEEFQGREMTDAEYIGIMYRTFFGREADEEGLAFWESELLDGKTKQYVFAGFANSDEFGKLCNTYGIIQGSVPVPEVQLPTDVSYFSWEENADGTLTITKWLGGSMEECIIPAKIEGKRVTVIGKKLFFGNGSIKKVILPKTITRIEEYAFCSCGITEVFLPDSLEIIEPNNFDGCRELTTLHLPASVISFSIENQRQYAPCNNDSLKAVTVAENNPVYTSVDGVLYSKDMATLIYVPDAKSGIFEIPETVTTTISGAFTGCKYITEIVIPAITVYFDEGYGTGLYWLDSLERYVVAEEHPLLKSVDGALLSKDGTKLIHVPALAAGESYSIPDTVTVIINRAFVDCQDLKQLELPAELDFYEHEWVKMDDSTYFNVPYNITFHCVNIKSIAVEEGSNAYSSKDGMLYSADGKILVGIPGSTEHTEYVVPEGVTAISMNAHMYGDGLKKLILPSSLKTIYPGALQESKLEQVTFSDGITSIGGYAFYFTNLTSVNLPEGVLHVGNDAFNCCYELAEVTIPSTLSHIGTRVFAYCDALDNLVIPEGVESIGSMSFYCCTGLTNVKLPASITSIAADSFDECNLQRVYAPAGSYAEQWAHEQGYSVVNY